MHPSPRGSASYKKKDGTISISDDRKYLFWTPAAPPGASPTVTVQIGQITNLQQTPESSAKVALKVFVKEESHVFSFTSKESGRKEQEVVTEALRDTIAKAKAGTQLAPAAPAARGTDGGSGDAGQSAAMAIAKAISSQQDEGWYDDAKLMAAFQLQRSLLESNKALSDRFTQALRDKPESVSVPQFTAQFWSTRLHLLRAHAIEKAQKEGEYNVLPEIKYNTVIGPDGEPVKTLNMTKEQVALIFKQYPVVRQAFNETVPRPFADAKVFWSRFFASRLLKKLKGLRMERTDPQDAVLDKYLDFQETRQGPTRIEHVPHFIDLEGNEQNTKFHLEGDYEMRAKRHDNAILHLLNGMSEKLLSRVAPEDSEAHGPIGMDEGTFEQLRLRDLAMEDKENRVVLNVREQQRYLGRQEDDDLSADARLYAQQDPTEVLSSLGGELRPSKLGSDDQGTIRLDRAIGFTSDDEDEDEDDNAQINGAAYHRPRIGAHAALSRASTSILASIKQRWQNASTDAASLYGLSQGLFDNLTITHNTTTEFLHYFWTLFLSGNSSASSISGLEQLVQTLDKSLDRLHAVAEQAEKERNEKLVKLRRQVEEHARRTGKRKRLDGNLVGGGRKVVEIMMQPTVDGLKTAVEAYRKAYEEQWEEAAAAAAARSHK